jgi:hypothetical protein
VSREALDAPGFPVDGCSRRGGPGARDRRDPSVPMTAAFTQAGARPSLSAVPLCPTQSRDVCQRLRGCRPACHDGWRADSSLPVSLGCRGARQRNAKRRSVPTLRGLPATLPATGSQPRKRAWNLACNHATPGTAKRSVCLDQPRVVVATPRCWRCRVGTMRGPRVRSRGVLACHAAPRHRAQTLLRCGSSLITSPRRSAPHASCRSEREPGGRLSSPGWPVAPSSRPRGPGSACVGGKRPLRRRSPASPTGRWREIRGPRR